MITQKTGWREFIAVLAATLIDDVEPITNFDPFNRINAHHGRCNFSIEAIKNGFAPARRKPVSDNFKFGAYRVTLSPNLGHKRLKLGN